MNLCLYCYLCHNQRFALRNGAMGSGAVSGALLLVLLWGWLTFTPVHAQTGCSTPYTVQPGDSWFKIARQCAVDFGALREVNLALWQRQGDTLYVGDLLQLPQPGTPAPTPTYAPLPTSTPFPAIHSTVRETVRFFWQAVVNGLRTGDFRTAYAYLSPQLQNAITYPTFTSSFAGLHEVTMESVTTVQENGGQAIVDVAIIAAEQTPSTGPGQAGWQYNRHRYRYTLHLNNGQWRFVTMETISRDPPDRCADAHPTRLQRGGRAYVLPQPPVPNRVFREPNRQSALVGRIYPNEAMTLLDGPRCAQRSVWWYVQADNGVMGWTAEGQPGEYWLAPIGATPPPGQPVVGPIVFCTAVDTAGRCLAPTTQFPIGLKRIEVNWTFQNLPLATSMTHIWYHNGRPFFTRTGVLWAANRSSTSGWGHTFYAPLGGLPTGTWVLELRRQRDNQLLQRARFSVGPAQ